MHFSRLCFSCEPGAGKTETIKIVMNHLATVERSRPLWPDSDRSSVCEQGSEQVVNRVLHSNPIFETFGNAKTLRNDNSSRFGKFTQLLFDVETAEEAARGGRSVPSCHLIGSKCITYLLEKSRVVKVSEGERTYHIFYQLIGAPDEAKGIIWDEGLVGAEISDFSYLSSSSGSIDGLASGENWNETVESLAIFGIDGELFLDIMRSLCVILQLGNITFGSEFVDGEEQSHISSAEALQKLSELLGVSETDIETSMIKRFMVTRGEEFTISLKANEAKDGCDALAKEIYARVSVERIIKILIFIIIAHLTYSSFNISMTNRSLTF
jgi:myosin-5